MEDFLLFCEAFDRGCETGLVTGCSVLLYIVGLCSLIDCLRDLGEQCRCLLRLLSGDERADFLESIGHRTGTADVKDALSSRNAMCFLC